MEAEVSAAPEPALYMLPVGISDADPREVLPERALRLLRGIRHFVVEDLRSARRFLKRCDRSIEIDALSFAVLNEHTPQDEVSSMLAPLRRGEAVGMMSEAGCPGVADPGADLAAAAQREGLKVAPLVGPSSLLLALMASGMNGQHFAFHGYLPVEDDARRRALRDLERLSERDRSSHLFIETPYRNSKMLAAASEALRADTLLCVATALTDPVLESVKTLPAASWKGCQLPKEPTVFIIQRP